MVSGSNNKGHKKKRTGGKVEKGVMGRRKNVTYLISFRLTSFPNLILHIGHE